MVSGFSFATGEFRTRPTRAFAAGGFRTRPTRTGLSKYPQYSWITKIDFLDSLFISKTGKTWDQK